MEWYGWVIIGMAILIIILATNLPCKVKLDLGKVSAKWSSIDHFVNDGRYVTYYISTVSVGSVGSEGIVTNTFQVSKGLFDTVVPGSLITVPSDIVKSRRPDIDEKVVAYYPEKIKEEPNGTT